MENKYVSFKAKLMQGEMVLLPFNLYLIDDDKGEFIQFSKAGIPLTESKIQKIFELQANDRLIAIKQVDKTKFIEYFKVPDDKISEAREITVDEGQAEIVEPEIVYPPYYQLIEKTRAELIKLPVNVSQTVSNTKYLAESLMLLPSIQNLKIALSYQLALAAGIHTHEELSAIVMASYLADIGYCMLPYKMASIPSEQLSNSIKDRAHKHPTLALHFIRKSQLNWSKELSQLIEEHHETNDGMGYPQGKIASGLGTSTQILSLVTYLIEKSEGQVDGEKLPIEKVLFQLGHPSEKDNTSDSKVERFHPDLIAKLNTILSSYLYGVHK